MRSGRLLFLTLLLASCGDEPKTGSGHEAIYDAVLDHVIATKYADLDIQRLVVHPTSRMYRAVDEDWNTDWTFIRSEYGAKLREDTCADFLRINATPKDLSPLLRARVPVTYFTWGEFDTLTGGGTSRAASWTRFYERHPGAQGFLSLSLPGVSSDGNEALVWVHNIRGRLNAWGGLCILRRRGGIWEVEDLHIIIVS